MATPKKKPPVAQQAAQPVKTNGHIGPAIIVLTNAFVFIGDLTIEADGSISVIDAVNVRQYGTEGKGLAALAHGPRKATVLDYVGVMVARQHAFLFHIPVVADLQGFLAVANKV
jgi:hypothetical protein